VKGAGIKQLEFSLKIMDSHGEKPRWQWSGRPVRTAAESTPMMESVPYTVS